MYQFDFRPLSKSWNPVEEWEKEFAKMFNHFSPTIQSAYNPSCEIIENESNYILSLDIPGLKKEHIEIEVKDNQLVISGERKQEAKTENKNLIRSEKRYGKFTKVFSIPKNVNSEAIEAIFQDGVLELSLPKENKSQTRKISISNWKDSEQSSMLNS